MTLADAYTLLKTGTLWAANGRCKGYAVSNPGEAAKIDTYVAALAAGQTIAPPVLTTATGRGMVGMLAALSGEPVPPPSPPPPDPGSIDPAKIIRDMRATWMTKLWSNGADDQGQEPAGFWKGLVFQNGDITLVPDGRYGQVYRVRVNGASSNPWYNDATSAASQVSVDKIYRLGQWDWYATAFKLEKGYTVTPWGVIHQFNYPTLSSPPIAVGVDAGGVGLDRLAGRLRETSPGNGFWYVADVNDKPRFLKITDVAGKWVEMILGVKAAFDATGAVRCYTRCRDNGETEFVQRLTQDNVPTLQYRDGQPKPTGGLDELGLYFGYPAAPASWPTNYVQHRGFIVCADEPTARAVLT